jgi:hypothetical protein
MRRPKLLQAIFAEQGCAAPAVGEPPVVLNFSTGIPRVILKDVFVHVHKLNKPILVLVFVICVPLGAMLFGEWLHMWTARNYPLVEGTIIHREPFSRFGGIPAGRLSIRIAHTDTIVIAEVNKTAMENFPNGVRFHYSGNPAREVFLEGEENPFWAVVFLWGSPLILLVMYVTLKGRPGMENVIS